MKHNKARPTDRQTGSALVVSLIMLSAVTFLAIISMESSSVQLKMVSNSQKSEQVFQAALSELEAQFSESNEYGDAEDTLYEAMTSFTIDEDGNFLSFVLTLHDRGDQSLGFLTRDEGPVNADWLSLAAG